MFTDDAERRDWLFGLLVTVLVIGVLYFIRSHTIEQNASREAPAEVATISEDEIRAVPTAIRNDMAIPESTPVVPAIARIFECERNGQRILSDRPCGAGVSVRYVVAPNTMDAQDTSGLYRAPPRSVQVQRVRASQAVSFGSSRACESIEEQIDAINSRMRKGYRNQEGEWYRERLRRLSAQRHEARCIR